MEKFDWRMLSRRRGLRVMSFAIPVFLLSVFGSSQISRLKPVTLYESPISTENIQSGSFRIRKNERRELPVQMAVKTNLRSDSRKARMALRYELWTQQRDLMRRQTIRLQSPSAAAAQTDFRIYSSPIFSLESGQSYIVRWNLVVHKQDRPLLRDWQVSLIQDPIKPSNKWLQGLELLIYPSLAINILALVMVLGPKLIH